MKSTAPQTIIRLLPVTWNIRHYQADWVLNVALVVTEPEERAAKGAYTKVEHQHIQSYDQQVLMIVRTLHIEIS